MNIRLNTHWELCKIFESDLMNKWYIHKPEPVQENKTHKLLWNFDIPTDHLLSVRQPDQLKKTCQIVDFTVPADHRVKLKESEKNDKYRDLVRELKKLWNMKVTVIPFVIGVLDIVTKGLVQ